jgi:regulatory protein
MARAAKKLDSEDQLYQAALRSLMRRAHSVHEMRAYLGRRAERPALAGPVIARLRTEGLLDDARYAREFARQHAENRRQGRYRIARELRARGVPDRHIEAALDECFAKADESALLRERIARGLRKMGRRPGDALEERQLASLYRSLLRAGFSADDIRREIRNLSGTGPGESAAADAVEEE